MITITAVAQGKPFTTDKVASVPMVSEDGTKFDALAFNRAVKAQSVLSCTTPGDKLTIHGSYSKNPRNGLTTFIVDNVQSGTKPEATYNNDGVRITADEVAAAHEAALSPPNNHGRRTWLSDELRERYWQLADAYIKDYGSDGIPISW